MLYHWYELDLEANVPTDADEHIYARSCAPIIAFDQDAAITQARSGGLSFSNVSQVAKANNDIQPDPIADRLRAAGLGIIGDPAHRVEPGHYDLSNRVVRFANALFSYFRLRVFQMPTFMLRAKGKLATSCSHTIVAKATDDYLAESDGAERQRFEPSERQSAN